MTTERKIQVGQVEETLTYDARVLHGHIQDVINFLENTRQKIHNRLGVDVRMTILDHGEDAPPEVEFYYLRPETEHETRIREHQEQAPLLSRLLELGSQSVHQE